jgi:cytochrome b involved in lipid metabolism
MFENEDYKSKYIQASMIEEHNTADNAWISIDEVVYSIQKEDMNLLSFFKDYYGKDVKMYLSMHGKKIYYDIMKQLRNRKIGVISK